MYATLVFGDLEKCYIEELPVNLETDSENISLNFDSGFWMIVSFSERELSLNCITYMLVGWLVLGLTAL